LLVGLASIYHFHHVAAGSKQEGVLGDWTVQAKAQRMDGAIVATDDIDPRAVEPLAAAASRNGHTLFGRAVGQRRNKDLHGSQLGLPPSLTGLTPKTTHSFGPEPGRDSGKFTLQTSALLMSPSTMTGVFPVVLMVTGRNL
jgi:hypothetical protein